MIEFSFDLQNILNKYAGTSGDNIEIIHDKLYAKILEYKISKGLNENIPLYKHDCDKCIYMGDFLCANYINNNEIKFQYYDLYVHIDDVMHSRSLIARYGNEPSEYESTIWFDSKEVVIQLPAICHINPFTEIIKRYKTRCGAKCT